MRRSRTSALLAAVALVAGACSDDDGRDAERSSSTNTTAAAVHVEGVIDGEPLHVLTVPNQLIVDLTMWDHYVAWGSGPRGSAEIPEIWLWDLDTDRSRRVARAESPGGTTSWVRGDRDVLVYGDQASLASDDTLSAPWTMRLVDLRDDSVRTIASSGSVDDEFGGAPYPDIDLPWVIWGQAEGQTSKIVAYNVDTGVSHVVRVAAIGQVYIDGTRVVFTEFHNGVSGAYELDVTSSGAEPRSLGAGDVGVFYVDEGRAAWNGPRGVPEQSVWVTSVTGAAGPEEIPAMKGHRVTAAGSNWVATRDRKGVLKVANIATGEVHAMTDQPIDNGAEAAFDGDRLVWRMYDSATIVVARLTE